MLKGLDPRLGADVLHTLRAMGHGDMLTLVDTNFPGHAMAAETVLGRPLLMENLTLAEAAEAVLSVLPLDTFVDDFAGFMAVVDEPETVPEVHREVQVVIDAAEGGARPVPGIERFAFYEVARASYAIVLTGERRAYGNVMLRKGVIGPEG
ncbi:MAG: RbsD/FucU domain-containing protein [Paracoccaceae bacterium]|nr:RbsD/FucU domain-containing protein [Paracoccaceae bacterium]